MEKFYTIKNNYAEIKLNKNIYPLVSIKKAIANFLPDYFIKIDDISKDEYLLQIETKTDSNNIKNLIGEFYNELLRESLRYNIATETKNIRELIVGRALYTTCIDMEEEIENSEIETYSKTNNIEVQDYSLDDIAVNWFDKYGNEEE